MNTKQPDIDGKCPKGTILCGSDMSNNYGICIYKIPNYSDEELQQNCPITKISIQLKTSETHSQEFILDDSSITFSKDPTNLPLTQFRADSDTPCVHWDSALSYKDG